MANRPKGFAEAELLIDGITAPGRADDAETERLPAEASSSCQADWTILRTSPVNGLIVGPVHLTAAALACIDSSLREPVVYWDPSQTADTPELTHAGTLVIRDVHRLDARQQERLLRWLWVDRRAAQVLALAPRPLFAEVVDGRFSSDLYYRLNTVLVEVRAQSDLPSP